MAILLIALAVAIGLFWLDPTEPSYLWLGLTCVAILADLTSIVLPLYTTWLLRRFLLAQREREQWRQEIEQARQVQQMLIPEALPDIVGLTIESVYRPAQQVGGDFFQIIPGSASDSVLIVAGDVTGHGLKAGMLVALIIGVIRNEHAHTKDPLSILQALNRALCERRHAHATCLALQIEANGAVTLANAGHLPPCLNEKELPMEGAMLLGMIEDAEFSVMHFQLQLGDVLISCRTGSRRPRMRTVSFLASSESPKCCAQPSRKNQSVPLPSLLPRRTLGRKMTSASSQSPGL
jgi:hypothetical protein